MRVRGTESCVSESAAVQDAAAEWHVRRHAGLSPAEQAEFERWLHVAPVHAQAFAELEKAMDVLGHPRASGRDASASEELLARRQSRRRRRSISLWTTLSAASAAAVAVLLWVPRSPPVATPLTSIVFRPDRQILPDGTTVELNAGAEIAVSYRSDERGVHLVHGEALFSVAKDATRPFVVRAGGIEVRAVGTAFSVHFESKKVDVLVTEGRVLVAASSPAQTGAPVNAVNEDRRAEHPILVAGQRLVIPIQEIPEPPNAALATTVSQAEIDHALAWRGRRVEFSGTRLAEALEVFNRQNRIQLAVHDSATGQIEISGIFWADNPEALVRLLDTGLNLQADRTGESIVLRRR